MDFRLVEKFTCEGEERYSGWWGFPLLQSAPWLEPGFWYILIYFFVCFWYILIHFFGIFLICSDIQDCILIFHAEIDKLIFPQTIMTRKMFWWFLLTQLARWLKALFLWFSSWCWHVTFCRNWYVSCTKMTFSMNHRFAPSTSDHINIW